MAALSHEPFTRNSLGVQEDKYIFSAFAAVTWYNAIELVVLCLTTFKHYRGCYFWSLLITSFGLILNCLSYMFFFFYLTVSRYVAVTLGFIAMCCVVTGHSLVLWSRLHLILRSSKTIRIFLWIIIVDAILFQVPSTVLIYIVISSDNRHLRIAFTLTTFVQLIGFCMQESLISFIYIWETIKMLRLRSKHFYVHILIQLFVINVCIILLDLAVISIHFAGYYTFQMMFKLVAYSIKLKLEFCVLGQLIHVIKEPISDHLKSNCDTSTSLDKRTDRRRTSRGPGLLVSNSSGFY
ncbi:hypothetical protein BDV23DRAFT_176985 [Aspergillus alliaceus]|uniref:DUF7703 domain-containing protein n=1 Tax=Petromyces alliaceus TaxID=209559 RepID=A0A5N7BRS8_PETAA|nr:hypothetical protein BDV23DRAFT_176985 [Aspergillus alliaceus]